VIAAILLGIVIAAILMLLLVWRGILSAEFQGCVDLRKRRTPAPYISRRRRTTVRQGRNPRPLNDPDFRSFMASLGMEDTTTSPKEGTKE
jgi:hypothetical protein